jgi:hypothetical protein
VIVLAIDPGNVQSAFVVYDGEKLFDFGKWENERLLNHIRSTKDLLAEHMAIEHIANMGMSVGQSVFDTCLWSGRFIEAWWDQPFTLIKRREVKSHICGNQRAKDSNIRTALIDRFSDGKGKDVAIGKKKAPGPLFGVAADVWSALAIAVTWTDTWQGKAVAS